MSHRLVTIGLVGLLSLPFTHGIAMDRTTGEPFATRSEVIAKHGMAATSHPLATQVAIDILKSGGNAVDAAIAANATLGLMEPTGCGIGGDLFAIVWIEEKQKLYGLNASGRSPLSLSLKELKKQCGEEIPAYGPLPVSVPGCVDGWFELHSRFGNLSMKRLLEPATDYAEEGFPVTEVIADGWQSGAKRLQKYPGFKQTYMPLGRAPRKGEIFKNPYLARTLKTIGNEGRDAFYKGDIAKTIAKYMQEQGGYLTLEDLSKHRSEWVEPVSVDYRGYRLWELPPNGQGIAALQMLAILKAYDLREMGFGSADHMHLFTEAKKLAFEDRAKFYADPDFHKIPVDTLISDDYAHTRRALLRMDRAAKTYAAGNPHLESGDTIYLTVADEQRNMVSLIQSNYRGFGSGMCPTELGFCLQDRGQLFDLQEGNFNTYAPGKRPFHTIIPAFITKQGKPYMSFGVMGGATQPQAHAQIVMNIVDFDMNLQEAGDAPRMVHGGSSQPTGSEMKDGGYLQVETGFPYKSIRALLNRGHQVRYADGPFGGYQAIRYDAVQDVYYGASESRKDGQAAGF